MSADAGVPPCFSSEGGMSPAGLARLLAQNDVYFRNLLVSIGIHNGVLQPCTGKRILLDYYSWLQVRI